MTANPHLKPCPFCGSDDVVIREVGATVYSIHLAVACKACETRGPVVWGITKTVTTEDAEEAWNKRKAAA